MITLYQFEISPFCDKVRRVLHLKGQPYTVREVSLFEFGRGLVKKLHPSNKVPVIDHDGTIVADSTHILAHLERAFPEPSLYPSDPRDRAIAHILEDWADESLYFYEMCMRFTFPHNAERWKPELLKHDSGVLRSVLGALFMRTTNKQLAGQGTGRKGRERVAQEAAAVRGRRGLCRLCRRDAVDADQLRFDRDGAQQERRRCGPRDHPARPGLLLQLRAGRGR